MAFFPLTALSSSRRCLHGIHSPQAAATFYSPLPPNVCVICSSHRKIKTNLPWQRYFSLQGERKRTKWDVLLCLSMHQTSMQSNAKEDRRQERRKEGKRSPLSPTHFFPKRLVHLFSACVTANNTLRRCAFVQNWCDQPNLTALLKRNSKRRKKNDKEAHLETQTSGSTVYTWEEGITSHSKSILLLMAQVSFAAKCNPQTMSWNHKWICEWLESSDNVANAKQVPVLTSTWWCFVLMKLCLSTAACKFTPVRHRSSPYICTVTRSEWLWDYFYSHAS